MKRPTLKELLCRDGRYRSLQSAIRELAGTYDRDQIEEITGFNTALLDSILRNSVLHPARRDDPGA